MVYQFLCRFLMINRKSTIKTLCVWGLYLTLLDMENVFYPQRFLQVMSWVSKVHWLTNGCIIILFIMTNTNILYFFRNPFILDYNSFSCQGFLQCQCSITYLLLVYSFSAILLVMSFKHVVYLDALSQHSAFVVNLV